LEKIITYFERVHPKHFTAFLTAAAEIAAQAIARRKLPRPVLSLKLARVE